MNFIVPGLETLLGKALEMFFDYSVDEIFDPTFYFGGIKEGYADSRRRYYHRTPLGGSWVKAILVLVEQRFPLGYSFFDGKIDMWTPPKGQLDVEAVASPPLDTGFNKAFQTVGLVDRREAFCKEVQQRSVIPSACSTDPVKIGCSDLSVTWGRRVSYAKEHSSSHSWCIAPPFRPCRTVTIVNQVSEHVRLCGAATSLRANLQGQHVPEFLRRAFFHLPNSSILSFRVGFLEFYQQKNSLPSQRTSPLTVSTNIPVGDQQDRHRLAHQ